jgi:hypothetical protein
LSLRRFLFISSFFALSKDTQEGEAKLREGKFNKGRKNEFDNEVCKK